MGSDSIQYARLDADELAKNARWWEIYEECFPIANEREHPIAIIESLRAAVGTAYHAHENGRTIAIARTHILSGPKEFLAYIGVTESHRRRGVAEALYRTLPEKDRIFEVEDPMHAARYNTTAEACRERIGWYRNHFGATLLDCPYLQPPLVDGADPLPMRLMWTGKDLTKPTVLEMVWELYEKFFHQTNHVAREVVEDCIARLRRPDGSSPSLFP
jgi:GNAT superfamily N-acetyltransferase